MYPAGGSPELVTMAGDEYETAMVIGMGLAVALPLGQPDIDELLVLPRCWLLGDELELAPLSE